MSQAETMDMLLAGSIKSAAILSLAGLVNAAWRGASASTRHPICTIGVASSVNADRIDDSLRPAYEKAVDAINSDYYRGSALSALRRSMAR